MDSVVYYVIKGQWASHPLENAIESREDVTVGTAGRLIGMPLEEGGGAAHEKSVDSAAWRGDLCCGHVSEAGFILDHEQEA